MMVGTSPEKEFVKWTSATSVKPKACRILTESNSRFCCGPRNYLMGHLLGYDTELRSAINVISVDRAPSRQLRLRGTIIIATTIASSIGPEPSTVMPAQLPTAEAMLAREIVEDSHRRSLFI
jgi:hypothetical protein